MKLINQSAEYLPQQEGLEGVYKQIELAGRTSYLSYDKITDDSAKKFVDMIIKNKHHSVLEHGTVYLKIPVEYPIKSTYEGACKYIFDKYTKTKSICEESDITKGVLFTSTNLRVLQENNWLNDLQYLCEPTTFHEKRLSVKVITSIGIVRELRTHRLFSFVNESTRYCSYDKGRFDGQVTFILPYWVDRNRESNTESEVLYLESLIKAEKNYLSLIKNGCSAQQAREILPLSTKSELVMTAFESDWRHFFDLRLFGKTGEPHPDMKQLAELIKEQFEINGLWDNIMKYPSKFE